MKNQLIGKDPDSGKDLGQEEKGMTEDEMAGWDLGLQTLPTLCRSEALLLSVLVAACLALSTPGCMEGRHLTALLSGWAACRTCAGGHRVLVDSQGVPSDVAVTWPHVTS